MVLDRPRKEKRTICLQIRLMKHQYAASMLYYLFHEGARNGSLLDRNAL